MVGREKKIKEVKVAQKLQKFQLMAKKNQKTVEN